MSEEESIYALALPTSIASPFFQWEVIPYDILQITVKCPVEGSGISVNCSYFEQERPVLYWRSDWKIEDYD